MPAVVRGGRRQGNQAPQRGPAPSGGRSRGGGAPRNASPIPGKMAALNPNDWPEFLAECSHQDPAVALWTASTRAKLFQVIVRVLAEAKYLDNARSMRLTPRSLHPDVRRYLAERQETYVLDCLERAQ